MNSRIAYCSSAVCLATMFSGLVQTASATELIVRASQHEVRIEEGKCAEHNNLSCTPEPYYGQGGVTVSFLPLAGAGGCVHKVSQVAGTIAASAASAATPLAAEYAYSNESYGCAYKVCFTLGGFNSVLDSGPQVVELKWLVNGKPEVLTQQLLVSKRSYGRFAVQLKDAALASYASPQLPPVTNLLAR